MSSARVVRRGFWGGRADVDGRGAEPRAPRPAAAARARRAPAPAGTRTRWRDTGAVRAVVLHRALVSPGGIRARRLDPRARTPHGRPGDVDASDDPSRIRP